MRVGVRVRVRVRVRIGSSHNSCLHESITIDIMNTCVFEPEFPFTFTVNGPNAPSKIYRETINIQDSRYMIWAYQK